MSFGSSLRFDPDIHEKPLLFWELAKAKKNPKKFSYKKRDQRFPLRQTHLEEHCDECKYNQQHVQEHKVQSHKNFVKKNIANVGCKEFDSHFLREKPFANNVINRCSPRRRHCSSTITLTDTQLNTLLDAVRSLPPDATDNTIRFKLDGKLNELHLNPDGGKASEDFNRTLKVPKEKIEACPDNGNIEDVMQPGNQSEPARPCVNRSGAFDIGSLSPILDELDMRGLEDKCSGDSDRQLDDSKSLVPEHSQTGKRPSTPSATVSTSLWSDLGTSEELPPLVPQAHLTMVEKKKPKWIRERAEFEAHYDPWGRRGMVRPKRSSSRAGSILTDYPVMDDEKKVLSKMKERTKWLTELEKQCQEQRIQRVEMQIAQQEVVNNKFLEKFSHDQKPVPLPRQVNIQKDRSVVTMMPSRFYT